MDKIDLATYPSIWNRIYGFTVAFFSVSCSVAAVMAALGKGQVSDHFSTSVVWGLSGVFMFSFLYMITYSLFVGGKSKFVKCAWVLTLVFIATIVGSFLLSK